MRFEIFDSMKLTFAINFAKLIKMHANYFLFMNIYVNHNIFRLITQLPSLLDPYTLLGDHDQFAKQIGTSDNINNSYSDQKLVKLCPEGKRIDHILFNVDSKYEVIYVILCFFMNIFTKHLLFIGEKLSVIFN